MQLVPAGEVREGQTVAQEVRDPHGRILLARGQRLTAGLIERLHKFGVQAVYLRDGFGEGTPEVVRTELRRQCQEVLSASFGNIAQELALGHPGKVRSLVLNGTYCRGDHFFREVIRSWQWAAQKSDNLRDFRNGVNLWCFAPRIDN